MPRVQLLSDLHLEFHADRGDSFIGSLDPTGVDVLVLAGDVNLAAGLRGSLLRFCKLFPTVVFVAGNHEYYNTSPKEVIQVVRGVERDCPNFHWLRHTMVEVNGIRIAGTTLWYPEPTDSVSKAHRFWVNDYCVIEQFIPWVFHEHQAGREFLHEVARQADVVVTHHIPSLSATSKRFLKSPLNHFFCHDLTKLIEEAQPPLWLFGHTHDMIDVRIGNTRLVANPFGYPQEQGDRRRGVYHEKLLFQVEPRLR